MTGYMNEIIICRILDSEEIEDNNIWKDDN
jgi:hypothetical protein